MFVKLATALAAPPTPLLPTHTRWLWPSVMAGITLLCILGAGVWTEYKDLWFYVPYTFLGNSIAPLPYDGYVVWMGDHYPTWVVVVVGALGTVVIEFWNMELLVRILAQDSSCGFRTHPVTRWTLGWYQRAPFLALVGTCVLPIIPHYPMRILAVLGRYPMWQYQLSVLIGRGARYAWLSALGFTFHFPGLYIALASFIVLLFGIRGARKLNGEAAA